MQVLPCFLCGCKLGKRITKRGKPYFMCDVCGIQLFIRRKAGIERLEKFFVNAEKAELPYKQHAQNFHETQAILKEINDVTAEIKKIDSFWPSDEEERALKLLKMRRENLFKQLEECAKRKV